MNRAPAPRDHWWNDHKVSCGGTFHKIKEPESYSKKKETKKPLSDRSQPTIKSLFRKADDKKPSPSKSPSTPKIITDTDQISNSGNFRENFKGKGRKLLDNVTEISTKRRRIPGLFDPDIDHSSTNISDSESDDDLDRILEERRKQIDKKLKLRELKQTNTNSNKRRIEETSSKPKRPCVSSNDQDSVARESLCDCPACGMKVIESLINHHLDICLK